jgi:hypothetical protein
MCLCVCVCVCFFFFFLTHQTLFLCLKADLRLYANSERRTYVEVLDDFRHVKLPLSYLLDLIPPIQPRYYSIASSLDVCSFKEKSRDKCKCKSERK